MTPNTVELLNETTQASQLAAEIVYHPKIIPMYYLILQSKTPLGERLLGTVGMDVLSYKDAQSRVDTGRNQVRDLIDNVNRQTWATGFEKAFRNERFDELIRACIDEGRASIRETDPVKALMFRGNRTPPADAPELLCYRLASTHLNRNEDSPRWITLCIYALARAICVNASRRLHPNEQSDVSPIWLALKLEWLRGDGKIVAQLMLDMDRKVYSGKIRHMVGSLLQFALAEMSMNTMDSHFFRDLQETHH